MPILSSVEKWEKRKTSQERYAKKKAEKKMAEKKKMNITKKRNEQFTNRSREDYKKLKRLRLGSI